jgi:hypothetical protein
LACRDCHKSSGQDLLRVEKSRRGSLSFVVRCAMRARCHLRFTMGRGLIISHRRALRRHLAREGADVAGRVRRPLPTGARVRPGAGAGRPLAPSQAAARDCRARVVMLDHGKSARGITARRLSHRIGARFRLPFNALRGLVWDTHSRLLAAGGRRMSRRSGFRAAVTPVGFHLPASGATSSRLRSQVASGLSRARTAALATYTPGALRDAS